MKAMILAAGFGTRLMPFTASTPKPLFTIAGRTALDWMIQRLVDAGSTALIVNTHHLNTAIERFIASHDYGIPVETCYEQEILGTGGALKNVADFWDDQPFVVVNSDIFTDLDIHAVYRFHQKHASPVTLVVCNDPEFNSVSLRKDGTIIDFVPTDLHEAAWTFTGIHVIDPVVLDLIPAGRFSNIIDIYRKLMLMGKSIQAYIPQDILWDDLGTPARYARVARRETAKTAIEDCFPGICTEDVTIGKLAGDGSDRKWFRIVCQDRTMIMVDHGIREADRINEVDAFVRIGRHLRKQGVPLPEIYLADTFSGLVCLQDLGDQHLQEAVLEIDSESHIIDLYKEVIKNLVHMSLAGLQGFDTGWTWQTPTYDRDLIVDKECRYFVEAFLNLYAGIEVPFADLADEFDCLAEKTLTSSLEGFIHRDFQSRNVMLSAGIPYFIDFQGGRIGPVQYDLASLLIDPYVALSQDLQDLLLEYYTNELLSRNKQVDADQFYKGYGCCALTRNLQILGAFGHLSKNRGKTYFEAYIPVALDTLKNNLERFFPGDAFIQLKMTVDKAILKSSDIPVQSNQKNSIR
jgi:aminoglycoside/choline kinase family phosphotransferase/choline kinase